VDTDKLQAERQLKHIAKITGLSNKKRKSSDLVKIITANTRARKSLEKEAE
jgi:carbon-monoxide dehydrogenase iron sulfur subunit